MSQIRPLNESGVAVVPASGTVTVKIGPVSAREIWYPSNVHVSATTHVKESVCDIFAGPSASQPYFRDESILGSSGDNTGACNADQVQVGNYIWAVWTGADVGAQVILNVTGRKSV